MKKQYITPSIKSINVELSHSLLSGSVQGSLGGGNTDTQLTNGFRRNTWSNGWGD